MTTANLSDHIGVKGWGDEKEVLEKSLARVPDQAHDTESSLTRVTD